MTPDFSTTVSGEPISQRREESRDGELRQYSQNSTSTFSWAQKGFNAADQGSFHKDKENIMNVLKPSNPVAKYIEQ